MRNPNGTVAEEFAQLSIHNITHLSRALGGCARTSLRPPVRRVPNTRHRQGSETWMHFLRLGPSTPNYKITPAAEPTATMTRQRTAENKSRGQVRVQSPAP